ncbi:MAG TPA: fatty acid desaturase [Melioribacteraceae bacterium]|nr:fatty acid desaturase [Melioribacteraceae bacterium]
MFILFYVNPNYNYFLTALHTLLQGYLYTGLFITAHDAMHLTVSKNRKLNNVIGKISCFLFAGLSYSKLLKNHKLHHKYPGTEKDPDFYEKSQNFFIWWFMFLKRYATILQIVIMAIVFNLLKIWFDELKIWLFWVIPAILGTLQLFYFGTYVTHKYPHTDEMKPHNARTLKKNHFWAMISCYFFGYHYEHHASPGIPWWKLYLTKKL